VSADGATHAFSGSAIGKTLTLASTLDPNPLPCKGMRVSTRTHAQTRPHACACIHAHTRACSRRGAHLDKLAEVAPVALELARLVVEDVGAHIVKERRVVADDHGGDVGLSAQVVHQPRHVGGVQMVGGLVQQQDVGLQQHCARQRQLHLPACRRAPQAQRVSSHTARKHAHSHSCVLPWLRGGAQGREAAHTGAALLVEQAKNVMPAHAQRSEVLPWHTMRTPPEAWHLPTAAVQAAGTVAVHASDQSQLSYARVGPL